MILGTVGARQTSWANRTSTPTCWQDCDGHTLNAERSAVTRALTTHYGLTPVPPNTTPVIIGGVGKNTASLVVAARTGSSYTQDGHPETCAVQMGDVVRNDVGEIVSEHIQTVACSSDGQHVTFLTPTR